MPTFEEVVHEARRDGRICPQPGKWHELWELLPDKHRKGNGWEPSLPLILAAWDETPHMMKMIRLQEHIKWAEDHGALQKIYDYMVGLKPDDWFYGK